MRKLFLLVLMVVLFVSCKKSSDNAKSPENAEYQSEFLDMDKAIIRYPASLLSAKSSLEFEFAESVVPEHFRGSILSKSPFEFDPKIPGEASWISDKVLLFVPKEPMPAGKKVKGKLIGKIALGEQKNVNDFDFTFQVAEQEVVAFDGDFIAVKDKANNVKYEAILTFSQVVKTDQIKKDLDIKGPDGKVRFEIEGNAETNTIKIVTSDIKRELKGKNFEFSLPGKYSANNSKWTFNVLLPGINSFKIISNMDMTDPASNQYTYGFRFSDPIQTNLDLSGFISVNPEVEYLVKTNNKYLTLTGNFVPGREYQVKIVKGFPSSYGTKLSEDYNSKFSVNNINPQITWLSAGVYLPTSNDYKLQFKSVNVAQADLVVYEVYPQNIGFFLQYNIVEDKSENSDYYYNNGYEDLSRVAEAVYEKKIQITKEKNKWIKSEIDLGDTFAKKKNSVFIVQLSFNIDDLTGKCVNKRSQVDANSLYFSGDNYYTNPANSGYYYANGSKSKLLISSDIGLTAKKSDGGIDVFALNVLTAKPVENLKLNLFNYQNRILETLTTNKNGFLHFNQDGAYILGNDPSGIALLKTEHHAWEMNNFDVDGFEGEQNGVNIFMYTDRGVHRPGDTVYLSAIARINHKAPPEQQPILLTVKNPQGQTTFEGKTNSGLYGHISFEIPTNVSDPTGNWIAILQIADKSFTKTLKIETVKPNRLKVVADIPDKLSADDLTIKGMITAKYLFGAPASNLNALISMDIERKEFTAARYNDFVFSSPLKSYRSLYYEIYNGPLDNNGQYRISYSIDQDHQFNSLLNASLHTTVFEKGGSFTENYKSCVISPFKSYAGVKNIFNYNGASFGQKYSVPIVIVDEPGNPVSGKSIQVRLYGNRDYWWRHYDDRDQMDYKTASSTFLISENTYQSKDAPFDYSFTVEDYGQLFLEVTDLESGHESGFFFYSSRWGQGGQAESIERNFIQITTDKNVYNTGDVAKLSFDTPKEGIVILTLEKGNSVFYREWKQINSARTHFEIPVNAAMVPNCYASVFWVQPHNQNTNDLPMRLYGVKTLYVEDRSTRLNLSMAAPDEIAPREEFTVSVTSAAPKKASFTLAIVDDGLLDLTSFKTPSPWDFFFRKIRLAVQTLDNYDEIIGVLFPDIEKFFSIGGDEFDEERMNRLDQSKTKRFVPVVLYSSPITVNPGKTVTTKFKMPNYIGSVRVMLVGASENSYVNLEKTVPVKYPLMVLPTVPRTGRPGDTFAVPVTVFAMDSTIQNVELKIQTSDNLKVTGNNKIDMKFANPGEQDSLFKVQVGNFIGEDSVSVQAVSGKFKADNTVKLAVISPNPFYTEVTDTMLVKDASLTIIPVKLGIEGTNKAKIVFSRIPEINLDEKVAYLIRYPYGCIEQTTSSVFPQLYLNYLLSLNDRQKNEITLNINAAINRFSSFRIDQGFSYWPQSGRNGNDNGYSDWGTNYAGHFLIEAKDKGYHVPDDLYNHWLKNATANAKTVNKDNFRYQTYRLFLLALAASPDMGAMNLVRENYLNQLDPLSNKFLAAAYYLSGKAETAKEITQSIGKMTDYREMGGTYGSSLRDTAFMLYLSIKMNDMEISKILLTKLLDAYLNDNWYSTQETAMVLLAVSNFHKTTPGTGGMPEFNLSIEGQKEKTIQLVDYQMTMDVNDNWNKKITIKSTNANPLFVSFYREGIPLKSRIVTANQGLYMERKFYNEEGYPIEVTSLKQGQVFWAVYSINNPVNIKVEEIALTSIFPAGWEIVNTRLSGVELPDWLQKMGMVSYDYMDIRDDRVNWFFDLAYKQKRIFPAKLVATFKGEFAMPPVTVEAMYSPEFYARIAAGEVTVK